MGAAFPPHQRDAFATFCTGMASKLRMLWGQEKPSLEHAAIFHPGPRRWDLTSPPETGYRGADAVQFSTSLFPLPPLSKPLPSPNSRSGATLASLQGSPGGELRVPPEQQPHRG